MKRNIKTVNDINGLIEYFVSALNWKIDLDYFEDIEDITYDFDAEDIGLKEEAFAKIKTLRQLRPLVDGQRWGIFCVEFDSRKFEITALRKILSGLIPTRRNSAEHAVWDQKDLLFLCFWGEGDNRTIGIAHFEDKEIGLPQIKMIYCAPAIEDFTQIRVFEDRLRSLKWPEEFVDHDRWQVEWSSAFKTAYRQTINDVSTLTAQLAVEAQGIRDRILKTLEVETRNGYVHLLYDKFKDTLIHDMTETQFADMYAQTVVYGLFSARCMDETQEDFSAAEAVECIPSTNPFLKSLMKECLGSQNSKLSFDELEIGNVVDLLLHTKTDAIIQDFNRQTGGGREDPVIHFYEEFLEEYDKDQKVQRGVYYTPQPVVSFIVRAVDSIIKNVFGLDDGLAAVDTKEIEYYRESKRKKDGHYTQVKDTKLVPVIQVLDPATGTGTFIRQAILQVFENYKDNNRNLSESDLKKVWNDYVPKHLLPRLNAFELMMAPYAVAHMKLAMVLKDTGYSFDSEERLNVYLTNSLEEPGNSDMQMSMFADPLASESIAANAVKKNTGINIIIGNPPYSYTSTNRGEWILNMVSDYKDGLQERKIHIDDDYIKFIRLGQYYLKDCDGVLAYISNNSFINGLTHRVMRKKLMEAFDTIYIINLHGDSKKGEVAPDGSKDENVFDIQQGVCISFFIKNQKIKQEKATVFHYDLYGSREKKYAQLMTANLRDFHWEELKPIDPSYFFVPKDFSQIEEYNKGFGLDEAFKTFSQGIMSGNDSALMCKSRKGAETLIESMVHSQDLEEAKEILFKGKSIPKNWDLKAAISDVRDGCTIERIQYRPFDCVYTAYTETSCGWLWRPRSEVMNNLKGGKENLCLITSRMIQKGSTFSHVFVADCIADKGMLSSKDNAYAMPLYSYEEHMGTSIRKSNLSEELIEAFKSCLGLSWSEEKDHTDTAISSKDVFSYIYAYLHCPSYRNRFREFMTSEFSKIPYPKDTDFFWKMVRLGDVLIDTHLLRRNHSIPLDIQFEGDDRSVSKITYKNHNVYINKSSFFSNVPEDAFAFLVGSYQPAMKWLKDRKNQSITDEEIEQYIMVIEALNITIEVMRKIDQVVNI